MDISISHPALHTEISVEFSTLENIKITYQSSLKIAYLYKWRKMEQTFFCIQIFNSMQDGNMSAQ